MKICDECETVAHCTKHGCIPKVSAKDAITQAINALNCIEYGSFCINDGPSEDTTESAITALRSALAEQPAQQQEPVVCTKCGASLGTLHLATGDKNCPFGQRVRHSDCTPQPAQRKPLTGHQGEHMKTVIEMAHETLERMNADEHCREQYWSATDDELQAFAELVRADERGRMCQQPKECSSEKSTSNETNRSAVLGEGKQAD